MTNWKIVQGSQATRPAEIDAASSASTVYQRRNIQQIAVENEGEITELWQYEERQMSRDEFAIMQSENANAVAAIAFVTMAEKGDIDDVTAGEHADLFSSWAYPVAYKTGDIRRYRGELYRCVQDHTSQADWAPDIAASLWVKISDPTEEWPKWAQPVGAHDSYNTGDKVSHNGRHWISAVDGNVWEPGVYGWEEAQE